MEANKVHIKIMHLNHWLSNVMLYRRKNQQEIGRGRLWLCKPLSVSGIMSFFSSLTTLAFFSLPENGFCLALSAALLAQQSCLMDFPALQWLNTQKSYDETDREVIHILFKLFFFFDAANVYLLTGSSEDLPKGSRADEIV